MIAWRLFSLFPAAFYLKAENGRILGYAASKFALKAEIHVYTNTNKMREIFYIKARKVIDFSAAYNVFRSPGDVLIGTWRRKGFSSITRDHWELLDAQGNLIGDLLEDSAQKAMMRRLWTSYIPQSFTLRVNGLAVADYHQTFWPFLLRLKVELAGEPDPDMAIMVAAGGILLDAIEGRQKRW